MKKIKYGCDTSYATCIIVESTPNPQSSLLDVECISQQDFNEDVYEQLENIQTQSDLSELGNLCLNYVEVGGKIFVKNVLLKMESEICLLKEEVETLKTTTIFDKSLVGSGLDLDCLTDACSNEITTYGELLQALITKSCTP